MQSPGFRSRALLSDLNVTLVHLPDYDCSYYYGEFPAAFHDVVKLVDAKRIWTKSNLVNMYNYRLAIHYNG
jgi:hypothetical protein